MKSSKIQFEWKRIIFWLTFVLVVVGIALASFFSAKSVNVEYDQFGMAILKYPN